MCFEDHEQYHKMRFECTRDRERQRERNGMKNDTHDNDEKQLGAKTTTTTHNKQHTFLLGANVYLYLM